MTAKLLYGLPSMAAMTKYLENVMSWEIAIHSPTEQAIDVETFYRLDTPVFSNNPQQPLTSNELISIFTLVAKRNQRDVQAVSRPSKSLGLRAPRGLALWLGHQKLRSHAPGANPTQKSPRASAA